ncbi:MAG: hypothetical protein HKN03_09430 [Acidimicrobiales bacterium]|nr:hypothetical protein [Acidimicrobiales bacterium]
MRVVFSGHRIDERGRQFERFPPRCKAAVQQAIRTALQQVVANSESEVSGIASLASGGDILFHEACADLGVTSTIYLPLPAPDFIRQSVLSGGVRWVWRAMKLLRTHEIRNASELDARVPGSGESGPAVFERANIWMLDDNESADAPVMVLALWDGVTSGQLPGGTWQMVDLARSRGIPVQILDMNALRNRA